MRVVPLIFAAALLVFAEHPGMLISPAELAKVMNAPGLVILHVGSAEDYKAGHIPGARLITIADLSVTDGRGLRVQLPPVEELVRRLESVGVGDSSRVVIYPAGESVQSATRVWFTLDYLGLGDRAALLDGGLPLWKKEGRALSAAESAKVTDAHLTVRPNPARVVEADWLASKANAADVKIIDARLPEFYDGSNAGGMPRAGHIPSAVNQPFSEFFDKDHRFRPPAELRRMLEASTDQTVVTYCHIGMQATVPYFVARYLGINVKLYDGSFQDWSRRSDLPVVNAH